MTPYQHTRQALEALETADRTYQAAGHGLDSEDSARLGRVHAVQVAHVHATLAVAAALDELPDNLRELLR